MADSQILARSRTVLVEKLRFEDNREVVRKTYSFPATKDRLRGMFRGTLLGWNKARREYQRLRYLELAQIPSIRAIAWTCKRNALGFVTECTLTTRHYPGQDLAQRIQQGRAPGFACWELIGQSVKRMHSAGFWHRGLSARNLMIAAESKDIAWLDPTKSITYPAGAIPDEKRALDLLRFWMPLCNHTSAEARIAFAQGYGEDVDLQKWWNRIPNWKQASLRRELQREEARFEGREP